MNENEQNQNIQAPGQIDSQEQEKKSQGKVKPWVLALIGAGVLVIVFAVSWLLIDTAPPQPETAAMPPPTDANGNLIMTDAPDNTATPEVDLPIVGYSPTTGRGITDPDKKYQPICVMIDNEARAIPQSAIGKADVVYEMYVEGGETREMAVFNDVIPEKIGPVRSARICFLEMAEEWKPIYIHVGGSPAKNESNAFNRIRDMLSRGAMTADLDGTKIGQFFWRDQARKAPNNDYINGQQVLEKYKELPVVPERPLPFATDGILKDGGTDCKEIIVKYRSSYSVIYRYDEATGYYARFRNENPYVDAADGEQLMVSNVIIQYANANLYEDNKHAQIHLIGSGDCVVIRNGKAIEGRWEKKDLASRTVFLDKDGNEVDLKPGQTFIQVANPIAGGVPKTTVTMSASVLSAPYSSTPVAP